MLKRITAIVAILMSALATAGASAADCDAACLRSQLDRYLAALSKRDASQLQLVRNVRYTENAKVSNVGEGLWRSATGFGAYEHFMVDPVTQNAMFIGIVNEGDVPAIATIRLAVANDRITEIEHVVARKGSHALFAPQAFVQPHPSLSTPVKQRPSREKLIEIADSYFDGIENHDSKIVLASDACQRIENGVQTTNQPGRTSRNCAHSADLLTYINAVNDRRYPIVDVEHGIVVATILFDIPGETSAANATRISSDPQVATRQREPRTLLLTEWFKIDEGRSQHIEAIMHNLPPGAKSGWEK